MYAIVVNIKYVPSSSGSPFSGNNPNILRLNGLAK